MTDWMPSPAAISQTCHVAMAAWLVTLCHHYGLGGWKGFKIVFWFALVKEFFWDLTFEGDTFKSSMTDFLFYVFGAVAMTLVLTSFPPKE